jgi:hypothetical protein
MKAVERSRHRISDGRVSGFASVEATRFTVGASEDRVRGVVLRG